LLDVSFSVLNNHLAFADVPGKLFCIAGGNYIRPGRIALE